MYAVNGLSIIHVHRLHMSKKLRMVISASAETVADWNAIRKLHRLSHEQTVDLALDMISQLSMEQVNNWLAAKLTTSPEPPAAEPMPSVDPEPEFEDEEYDGEELDDDQDDVDDLDDDDIHIEPDVEAAEEVETIEQDKTPLALTISDSGHLTTADGTAFVIGATYVLRGRTASDTTHYQCVVDADGDPELIELEPA